MIDLANPTSVTHPHPARLLCAAKPTSGTQPHPARQNPLLAPNLILPGKTPPNHQPEYFISANPVRAVFHIIFRIMA
jgi:hypothetical protein